MREDKLVYVCGGGNECQLKHAATALRQDMEPAAGQEKAGQEKAKQCSAKRKPAKGVTAFGGDDNEALEEVAGSVEVESFPYS